MVVKRVDLPERGGIQRVGILGAGQLARMLAMRAHSLGLAIHVFASRETDPAVQACHVHSLGAIDDPGALRDFLSDLDYVTFESEFVDTDLLARCLPERVQAFPSLAAIATIQDRLTQKQLLDDWKIPTSEWLQVSDRKDLEAAAKRFTTGFVLKQRRLGYDGYGTFVCKRPQRDLDFSWLERSTAGFIAERFVPFRRELAVSIVRSGDGSLAILPLVETVQQQSRCFSVHGPQPATAALKKVLNTFKRLMNKIDYRGILAIELFDVGGKLLVNELAPRVHNSAHYSLDALTIDQFEYHLRAGLGWPLAPPRTLSRGFAMVNLLGEGSKTVRLSVAPSGRLHWYGKSDNRVGRKLGHITVVEQNARLALKRALKWRKDFQL